MSTEENKAIVHRLSDELWNKGNLAPIDELVAADVVVHSPTFPGSGRGAFKQWVIGGRAAFPDCQLTLEDLIAEGDKVTLRWTFRGAHNGELPGIPPTNQHVVVTGIYIYRIVRGQVVERWDSEDTLSMLQQLGVIPTPGQPPHNDVQDGASTPRMLRHQQPAQGRNINMSAEENKTLARRVREMWDKRDPAVNEYLASDAIIHMPGAPGPLDREQVLGMLDMFYSAFPDLHHTFEDQVAEGDKVVTRLTLRGTHRGEFQGIPPTGKQVAITGIVIDRYENGKLVEHRSHLDNLGMLQQLGVIPAPGQSGAS
jgi:steroid delta-isomerase-like uncharacterized protein